MKNQGIREVKSTIVGIIFLLIGIALFLDCWIEYTGTCGWENKTYSGASVILGLVFLFLDPDQIKEIIKALADWGLGFLNKKNDGKN